MDHPTVSVKQEILEPVDSTPIMLNGKGGCSGDSMDSSSDSSDIGEMNEDVFFDSTANASKSGFKHNRESDIGEEEEGEGGSRSKKPKSEGSLGINALPLGLPALPSTSACRTLVLNPEPLSMIFPDNARRSDEEVARSGWRSTNCKQFWKAGDFEGAGDDNSASSSVGMDHVRVHPKFLHSNATSHKWALGAFAELLDNSLDEVCNGATYVNVDMLKNNKDDSNMLLVEDDGGGMTPERMRQCMSLGYSAKSKLANTIGQYGNGFKTSTMRLGADVIVFSRFPGSNGRRPTQSIGMLSYSFLRGTGKEDIVVPIIDYEKVDQSSGWKNLTRTSLDDWSRNLETIIQWSPYSSEEDLLQQFTSMKEHGTRVVIYNLWEDDIEQLELDFDADPHDIQIRGVNRDEKNIQMASQYPCSRHYLTYRHSLRSYASILYLRLPPGFRIILRGVDVEHHDIENDMMLTKETTYRPQIQEGTKNPNIFANVKIGFVKDAYAHIDVQGFNVYHKNRLIKPFWRVWNAAGSDGRGVIGVLEANFIEPAHDKQGFERTTVLSRLEARLLAMQKNYWSSNCQKVGYAPRRRPADSSDKKSPNIGKTITDQNGHDHASVGPKTMHTSMGPNTMPCKEHGRGYASVGNKTTPNKEPNEPSTAVNNMFQNTSIQMQNAFAQWYPNMTHALAPGVMISGARTVPRPMGATNSSTAPRESHNEMMRGLHHFNSYTASNHEMMRRLHVKGNFGDGERLGSACYHANHITKVKQEKPDLRERSMEIGEPPTFDLLTELNGARERCKSLETKLRETEKKVEVLDHDQLALINFLENERTQRQQEENRLKKSLMDANKTIEELREKVRQLEGRNASTVKAEK